MRFSILLVACRRITKSKWSATISSRLTNTIWFYQPFYSNKNETKKLFCLFFFSFSYTHKYIHNFSLILVCKVHSSNTLVSDSRRLMISENSGRSSGDDAEQRFMMRAIVDVDPAGIDGLRFSYATRVATWIGSKSGYGSLHLVITSVTNTANDLFLFDLDLKNKQTQKQTKICNYQISDLVE